MKKQGKIIGSVQRALDILDLYDQKHNELGITEIGRALELPKSTAAGLISTLEINGYLQQNPTTRKYRLGYKLAERTGVYLAQFDLRQIATPILEELRDECNESVNLGVRDDDHIIYIERLHGMNMLGMRSEIGKRENIHSTALGKAILSSLPIREVDVFIRSHDLIPVTPHTITQTERFKAELKKTHKRGYAIDNQENELGGRCVAAPIFDYRGSPIAAVSVSVPLQRMPESEISTFGKRVREAADEISRMLGAASD